jgi:hypothetical protein
MYDFMMVVIMLLVLTLPASFALYIIKVPRTITAYTVLWSFFALLLTVAIGAMVFMIKEETKALKRRREYFGSIF